MSNPWDDRYSNSENYYGSEPNDHLREWAHVFAPNSSILSLGEGEGRNAFFLLKQGHNIMATDFSQVGLSKLIKAAESMGKSVETRAGDLSDFDFGTNKWDGIISIWCHMPGELRREIHKKAVASLKPGGIFILEAYTPEQLKYKTGGPPVADLMMTLKDLKSELSGLDFIFAEEKIRDVFEGKGHHGTSSVVQVVGRKVK